MAQALVAAGRQAAEAGAAAGPDALSGARSHREAYPSVERFQCWAHAPLVAAARQVAEAAAAARANALPGARASTSLALTFF